VLDAIVLFALFVGRRDEVVPIVVVVGIHGYGYE